MGGGDQGSSEWATRADASSRGMVDEMQSGTIGLAGCGNGAVEPGEECDGEELNGQSCESLGLGIGVPLCVDCRIDTSWCPVVGMVDVLGGVFEMGSMEELDEQPIRNVAVDRFWIDKTEVTVNAYAECVDAGGCTEPELGEDCNWMVEGREDHPVNCVNWSQAAAYCSWIDGGEVKRLPTEAEWEKAARGVNAQVYPWGESPEPSCDLVVMDSIGVGGGDGCGGGSTMAVGSKPEGASPYGAQDMAGNVKEWVLDFEGTYDPTRTDNPKGPSGGSTRIVRGGGYLSNELADFRAANRDATQAHFEVVDVGFRCVWPSPVAI